MSSDEIPDERRRNLLLAEIEALLRRVDAMPTIDDCPPEEILAYGYYGLPA